MRGWGVSWGSAPGGSHRWRGDYGGKKQLWFPSNYVEEMVSPAAALEPEREVRWGPWVVRVLIPRCSCAHPHLTQCQACTPHTNPGLLLTHITWVSSHECLKYTFVLHACTQQTC